MADEPLSNPDKILLPDGHQIKLVDFFKVYGIDSIQIVPDTDIRDSEASLVDIRFSGNSKVSFKLLIEAAQTHRCLRGIGPPPDCRLELTPAGRQLGSETLGEWVRHFTDAIESRVAKVHREQSIINIQPLGKTFELYGKTRFEVLSDDGRGQLTIRILREDGASEAGLSANDLLDGMYAGIISLVD